MTFEAATNSLKKAWGSMPNSVQNLGIGAANTLAAGLFSYGPAITNYFLPNGSFYWIPTVFAQGIAGLVCYRGVMPYASDLTYRLLGRCRVVFFNRSPIGPILPDDPKKPIVNLVSDIYNFTIRQPEGHRWSAAQPVQADEEIGVTPAARPRPSDLNQAPTEGLGANPRTEQINWQARSDENLKKLVENGANYTTLYFIHFNRLRFALTDTNENSTEQGMHQLYQDDFLMKIVQEASIAGPDGRKPSLWSVYMKHAGKHLGFFQKAHAYFWYVLCYSTGLIANSMNTFAKNILHEFRTKLTDKANEDRELRLDSLFQKITDHASSFLDIYNGAIRAYAHAVQPQGQAKNYRTRAIDNLTGESLSELCEKFTETTVAEFFPKVPFFENLKNSSWLFWLYKPLDFLIGAPLNWIGQKLVKYLMPEAIEQIVKKGIKSTDPNNLPFVTGITNTLAELIIDLSLQPVGSLPTEPLPGMRDLPIVVDKLLDTLDLMGTDDTQPALKKTFSVIDGNKGFFHKLVRNQIHSGGVRAAQAFFHHLVDEPQTSEKLFSKLLRVFNIAFEQEPPTLQNGVPLTPNELIATRINEYKQAREGLENAAGNFFEKIVQTGVQDLCKGTPNMRELLQNVHDAQQIDALESFNELIAISQEMRTKADPNPANPTNRNLLVELDHAIEVIKRFSNNVQKLKLEWLEKPALEGFYSSFHPIYSKAEELVKQILEIQDLQVLFTNHLELAKHFQAIQAELVRVAGRLDRDVAQSISDLEQLEAKIALIQSCLPQDAPEPNLLRSQIETLKTSLQEALRRENILKQYERLGGRGLLYQLSEAIQNRPAHGFSRKQNNAEITEALNLLPVADKERLKPLIRQLQSADASQELAPLWNEIQTALTELSDPHIASFDREIAPAQARLNQFQTWAARYSTAYSTLKDENNRHLVAKVEEWSREVTQTRDLIAATTVETQHHPLQYIPNWAIDQGIKLPGKIYAPWDIKKTIMDKFRSAYKLITSSDIYDATSRIVMHEMVKSYK